VGFAAHIVQVVGGDLPAMTTIPFHPVLGGRAKKTIIPSLGVFGNGNYFRDLDGAQDRGNEEAIRGLIDFNPAFFDCAAIPNERIVD
jgi:hypothetical protein